MTFRLKTYVCVTLACIVVTIQAAMASSGAGPMARSALLRQAIRNQVLTNHVIKSNTKKTWTRCVAACLDEDQCVSINYWGTGGICELNASHKEAHPGDVVDKDGWRYYGTQEKTPAVELQQTITTAAPTTAAPTTAAPATAAPTTAAPTTAAPTTAAPTTAAPTTAAPTTAAPATAAPTTAAPTTAAPTTAASTTAALTTAAPTTVTDTTTTATPAMQGKDCYDLLMMGETTSGVYDINVTGRDQPLKVYCEMANSGGGWTVFQRRQDGSEEFYLTWADYKAGFGDLTGEFWLGNDDIHLLTNQRSYQLIVIVRDWEHNVGYANYQEFTVASEADFYRLSVGGYLGNVGDSLTSPHNGMAWSTHDQDNDLDGTRNCAQAARGAWWYNACDKSNLNGPYVSYPGSVYTVGQGIIWNTWGQQTYSFPITEMKIRPAEVVFTG